MFTSVTNTNRKENASVSFGSYPLTRRPTSGKDHTTHRQG